MADNDLAQAIQTDPLEGIVPIYKRQTEKAAEQRGRQEKAAQAELLSQEAKYTKPAPEFKPTEESMSGFAAMGSLLAAAGAILGSNGRSSGLMAMNAVSGMMNGYNAGRKDLYEQQRQKFEESMKSWEKHREQVKDLFAQAAKLAPYNLSKAQQYLNDGLKSLGMQPLAEVNQRSGPIAAMSTFNRADQNMTSVLAKAQVQTSGLLNSVPPEQRGMFEQMLNSKDPKDVLAALEGLQAMKKTQAAARTSSLAEQKTVAEIAKLNREALSGGLTPEQQLKKDQAQAWADNLYNQFQKTGKPPVLKTMEEQQAYAYLHKGAPFVTAEDVGEKTLEPIKGQVRYVSNFIGKNEAESLGVRQIPAVGAALQAATLAYKLSADIQQTPEAAGVLSNVYNWIDKYRLNKPQDMEVNPQVLSNAINSDRSVFIDPKTGKDVAPDKFNRIKEINKLAVDVINARALAFSGGSKMLVSELNQQKTVIDPANMSPQSAFLVFKDLADRDIEDLEKQGLSDKAIQRAKTRARMRGEGRPIPNRQEFIKAAKQVNPNYTDEELNKIYSDKYGED